MVMKKHSDVSQDIGIHVKFSTCPHNPYFWVVFELPYPKYVKKGLRLPLDNMFLDAFVNNSSRSEAMVEGMGELSWVPISIK